MKKLRVAIWIAAGLVMFSATLYAFFIRDFIEFERGGCAQHETSAIRNAVKAYFNEYEKFPNVADERLIYQLAGENPHKIQFIETNGLVIKQGKILDPWGTPYRISIRPGEPYFKVEVRSAGRDKYFDTADDYVHD